jgi:hypothetical protein
MVCYNCGVVLNSSNKTKEHIPAQAFYAGYGSEYKVNRITVDACRNCNENYSKTDSEFRDVVGMLKNEINVSVLWEKSAKSILRRKTNPLSYENGNLKSIEFSYNAIKTTVVKDFKGLFYKKYGIPFPKNWTIDIIPDSEKDPEIIRFGVNLFAYLDKDISWSISGHKDIFRYKFKMMIPDKNGDLHDGTLIDKAEGFVSVQEYHSTSSFIVFAAKN